MFIISLEYVKPIEEVEKYLEAHRAFLQAYFDKNQLVCIGRKNPRTGGVIIAYNMTRAEADELAAQDPFNIHGVASYNVTEVVPTRCAGVFEALMD